MHQCQIKVQFSKSRCGHLLGKFPLLRFLRLILEIGTLRNLNIKPIKLEAVKS